MRILSTHLSSRQTLPVPDVQRPGTGFRAVVLGAIVLALPAVQGCIVAEPTPYEPPPRTPPILDLARAIPAVGDIIPVNSFRNPAATLPQYIEFSVPVRSEDADIPLHYSLNLDYRVDRERTDIAKGQVLPGAFDELTRYITTASWPVDASKGCHRLTLLVAHYDNWDHTKLRPDPVRARDLMAMAHWWINVDPDPGKYYTLENCPSPEEFQR